MDNNKKPVDLKDRTLEFSKSIIVYLTTLRKDPLVDPIKNQLIRSATSIGANFAEAKNASSKKDFRNKVFIAKKEASETIYWLVLLEEFDTSESRSNLENECRELVLILQKIINTLAAKD